MIIWLNKLIFIKTNLDIKDLIDIDLRPFKNIVLMSRIILVAPGGFFGLFHKGLWADSVWRNRT